MKFQQAAAASALAALAARGRPRRSPRCGSDDERRRRQQRRRRRRRRPTRHVPAEEPRQPLLRHQRHGRRGGRRGVRRHLRRGRPGRRPRPTPRCSTSTPPPSRASARSSSRPTTRRRSATRSTRRATPASRSSPSTPTPTRTAATCSSTRPTAEGIAKVQVDLIAEQIGDAGEIAILSATRQRDQPERLDRADEEGPGRQPPEHQARRHRLRRRRRPDVVRQDRGAAADPPRTSRASSRRPRSASPPRPATCRPRTYKGKVALTGLGTPNQMREYVKDGTVTAFALWNPDDLGYLAAYAAKALVDGDITGEEGDTFDGRQARRVHGRRRRRRPARRPVRLQRRQHRRLRLLIDRRPAGGPVRRPDRRPHRPTHRHAGGAAMQRVCFQLQVKPERLDEYVERHAAVWPEMLGRARRDRLAQLLAVPARRRPAHRLLRDADSLEAAQAGDGRHRGQRPLAGRDGRVLRRPRRPRARRRASCCSTRSSTSRTSSPGATPTARRQQVSDMTTFDADRARCSSGQAHRGALVGLRQLRHPVQGVRQRRAPRATVAGEDRRRRAGAPVHRARADASRCTSRGTRSTTTPRCARTPRTSASRSARSTPTRSRTTTTSSAALTHADPTVRQKAIDHHFECIDIMDATGSRDLKIWLADGTNYPGQDDMRGRQDRLAEALRDDLRRGSATTSGSCSSTSSSSRRSTTPTSRTGARRTPTCAALGDRAMVCLDTGHHAPGTNIEFIVDAAAAAREARLVRLQHPLLRRRRPDRRRGRPVPAVPDPRRGASAAAASARTATSRFMLDQCHNIEKKIPGQIRSVLNVQEMTARALLRRHRGAGRGPAGRRRAGAPTRSSWTPSTPTCAPTWPPGARSGGCPPTRCAAYLGQRLPGADRGRPRRRHAGRMELRR